jgi:hypothetical protein
MRRRILARMASPPQLATETALADTASGNEGAQ